MTNDNLCEQPIAWQVSAVDGRKDAPGRRDGCDRHAGFRAKGRAESQSAKAPDCPVRRLLERLEAVPMNPKDRARLMRARMRRLLDDADSGLVCLTQNAELLVELAEELREVEDEIDDVLIARAAGVSQ